MLNKFGIPTKIFAPIVKPGNKLGGLLPQVLEEVGSINAQVVNVAAHDTASAVLAVPAKSEDFIFLSSGTWSLMGIESGEPIMNEAAAKHDMTNEGGVFGTIRVLKNIMGLWLIQESRRQWKREGKVYSFEDLSRMALESAPFVSFVDPDDPAFAPAGNLPRRIREYCEKTGQHVPENEGEIVRCIYESLALKYRRTAELLEEVSGRTYNTINIVGGGTKEKMLSRFTADASHKKVCTGPVEATALGNIAMQAIAAGEISDLWEARRIIRNSTEIEEYTPNSENAAAWDEAYERFLAVTGA